MLDEMPVEIRFRFQHQALLLELELMEKEHQHDADQKGNERRVERHPQALGHPGYVSFNRLVSLTEC
jgi:hypothetical protein